MKHLLHLIATLSLCIVASAQNIGMQASGENTTAVEVTHAAARLALTTAQAAHKIVRQNDGSTWTLKANGNPATAADWVMITPAPAIPMNAKFVMAGDSLTAGYGGQNGWPFYAQNLSNFSGRGGVYNTAVAGRKLTDLSNNYMSEVYPHRPANAWDTSYLLVMVGQNDLGGGTIPTETVTAYFSRLEAYLTNAEAHGFKTVLMTVLPIGPSQYHPYRQQLNKLIVNSTVADMVIDGVELIQNPLSPTLFQADAVHLTNFGAEKFAAFVNGKIAAYGASPAWGIKTQGERLAIGENGSFYGRVNSWGDTFQFCGADNSLANTSRVFRMGSPTYAGTTIAPLNLLSASCYGSGNDVQFGGGTTQGYAATRVQIFAGATTTTSPGTAIYDANINLTQVTNKLLANGIQNGTLAGIATAPTWTVGSGSPEGVVIAVVGSFYSRLDGGAGTTFYVKESGTGNTGWIAK